MMPRNRLAGVYDIVVGLSAYLSGVLKEDDMLIKGKLQENMSDFIGTLDETSTIRDVVLGSVDAVGFMKIGF